MEQSRWRFSQGIEEVNIVMQKGTEPVRESFTPDGNSHIKQWIASIPVKQSIIESIEGKLLMANFAKGKKICEVYPATGNPVRCTFQDRQEEDVHQNLRSDVRVVGSSKTGSTPSGKDKLEIHSIERLQNRDQCRSDQESAHPMTRLDFGESPTLDEIVRRQNVAPIADIRSLYGTWPGDPDDGFEESIEELRHGKSIAYDD